MVSEPGPPLVTKLDESAEVICVDPAAIAFGEIAEHIMLHQVLVAGMTDTNADAAILIADVLGDRAQAIMPGDATADFHPYLRRRQIDLVVKHGDVRRR